MEKKEVPPGQSQSSKDSTEKSELMTREKDMKNENCKKIQDEDCEEKDDWSYCKACDLKFTNEHPYQLHLRGITHWNNEDRRKKEEMDEKQVSSDVGNKEGTDTQAKKVLTEKTKEAEQKGDEKQVSSDVGNKEGTDTQAKKVLTEKTKEAEQKGVAHVQDDPDWPSWIDKQSYKMSKSDIYCKICDLMCSGETPYKTHLEGQKHKKNLRKLEESELKASQEKEAAAVTEVDDDSEDDDDDDDWSCCKVCDVKFSNIHAYQIHIRSITHWQKEDERKKKKREAKGLPEPQRVKAVIEAVPVPKKVLDREDREYAQRQWPEWLTMDLTDNKSKFFCEVCNISCVGETSYQKHLKGQKHDKKMKRKEEMDRNMSNAVMPGGNLFGGVKTLQEAQIQKTLDECDRPLVGLQYLTEIHMEDFKDEPTYVCEICETSMDQRVTFPHLLGVKHRIKYMRIHDRQNYDELCSLKKPSNRASICEKIAKDLEKKVGRMKVRVRVEPRSVRELTHKSSMHHFQELLEYSAEDEDMWQDDNPFSQRSILDLQEPRNLNRPSAMETRFDERPREGGPWGSAPASRFPFMSGHPSLDRMRGPDDFGSPEVEFDYTQRKGGRMSMFDRSGSGRFRNDDMECNTLRDGPSNRTEQDAYMCDRAEEGDFDNFQRSRPPFGFNRDLHWQHRERDPPHWDRSDDSQPDFDPVHGAPLDRGPQPRGPGDHSDASIMHDKRTQSQIMEALASSNLCRIETEEDAQIAMKLCGVLTQTLLDYRNRQLGQKLHTEYQVKEQVDLLKCQAMALKGMMNNKDNPPADQEKTEITVSSDTFQTGVSKNTTQSSTDVLIEGKISMPDIYSHPVHNKPIEAEKSVAANVKRGILKRPHQTNSKPQPQQAMGRTGENITREGNMTNQGNFGTRDNVATTGYMATQQRNIAPLMTMTSGGDMAPHRNLATSRYMVPHGNIGTQNFMTHQASMGPNVSNNGYMGQRFAGNVSEQMIQYPIQYRSAPPGSEMMRLGGQSHPLGLAREQSSPPPSYISPPIHLPPLLNSPSKRKRRY